MNISSDNKKDNWISAAATLCLLIIVLVLLLACGLKSQVPPPPPKKTFYVELDASTGGGGGGGMETPTQTTSRTPTAPNYATQNAQDAPSVAHSTNTQKNSQPTTPKVNQNAIFKGGKGGSGSGGGSGNGSGSGNGGGIGPGDGNGSGGQYGIGTGHRAMTSKPSLEIKEDHGTVCIEVFIEEDGTVSKANIVPGKSSISNTHIQQDCLRKAKTIRYNKGKKERRYVIFGTE